MSLAGVRAAVANCNHTDSTGHGHDYGWLQNIGRGPGGQHTDPLRHDQCGAGQAERLARCAGTNVIGVPVAHRLDYVEALVWLVAELL